MYVFFFFNTHRGVAEHAPEDPGEHNAADT
jgi:hypothetical protein